MERVKTLIIGSGPAGYTAAIYAARAGLHPVLYTGAAPGGQLMTTTDVENYPGYPKGVQGPEMMNDFQQQAEKVGTDIRFGTVTKVDFTGPVHKVWVDAETEIEAHTIIIATGATAKWLGIKGEQRLNGNGVSACATCDGFFYKGKVVAVVGGGDTAAEEALYLANLCPKVHLLVRRDEMRASKIMQERVLKSKKIEMHWLTSPIEVIGEQLVEKVKVKNNTTGEESEIPVDGFFVAIGHKPNSEVFAPWLEMDDVGYIRTIPGSARTHVPGVFATGDVQDKVYRQAVTAAGSGCMGALDAERYISEMGVE